MPPPAVLTVLLLASLSSAENPGIKVVLSDKGLQYGKHVAAGLIQDRLDQVTLPDISGEILGVHYTLTGISIVKCDFPEPSVDFYQDVSGFRTSLSGLSVAVSGGWLTHCGLIHDGGSFDMAVFSVDVTSAVELGRDDTGHPSISSVHCEAQVGRVDIQFHGGASWIFQPFVEHFKGRIRGKIQASICPSVEEYLVNLEYHLQAMRVSVDVSEDFTFEFPLTAAPIINASSLNLGLKGEIYNTRTHSGPPFEAQPFSLPVQPAFMLTLGLSEFTLNSASYGLFSAGRFQLLINDSMIPAYIPLRLNTSSMGPYVPQLPDLFPDLLMELQVYATEMPSFSLQSGVLKLDVQGGVKAFAVQLNGTLTPLFTLSVDLNSSGKMWIDGGRLKGSMTLENLTLTLAASEVGTFQTDALQRLTKTAATMALAKLNVELGKGVLLPRMKHLQLVHSVLQVEQGFIAVASDAQVLTDRCFKSL